jgi:hypothetical protein
VITNCSAGHFGGGAFQGYLSDCVVEGNTGGGGGGTALAIVDHSLVQGNSAINGGGVLQGLVRRSRIFSNIAAQKAGGFYGPGLVEGCAVALNQAFLTAGIYYAYVFQSTIISNSSPLTLVGGVDFSTVWNSIVYFNVGRKDVQYDSTFSNLGGSADYYNVCFAPFRAQIPGITNNPEMLDLVHCATSSPCRGAGLDLGIVGFSDVDGEAWTVPPTIGCDELLDSKLVGPLTVQLSSWPDIAAGGIMPVSAIISGRASALQWDFGDGGIVSDVGYSTSHSWINPGEYTLKVSVSNLDHPAGVTATAPVHVVAASSPTLSNLIVSNGVFSLPLLGQPGLTYLLQSATNLAAPVDWQPVQILFSTGEVSLIEIPSTSDPNRFYRLQIR